MASSVGGVARERQPEGVRAYRSGWSWIDASACDALRGLKVVIDLTRVKVIRRDSAHVLRDMKNHGPEFICLNVYVRHVLRDLNTLCKSGANSADTMEAPDVCCFK